MSKAFTSLNSAMLTLAQPKPMETAYSQFWNQLQKLSVTEPGWYGWTINSYASNQHVSVQLVCPHGQGVETNVSIYAFDNCPDGASLANACFQQLRAQCDQTHSQILPQGQYVYTYTQQEPYGYLPDNGGPMIKMDELVKQYQGNWNIEYLKQMESQMIYGYSQSGSVSAGGSGGPGILGGLMSICPGLVTVCRPCPECHTAQGALSSMIPHINDVHQWSREKIASWLDIISDDPDVDLTIQPKKKETKREQPSISASEIDIAEALGYGNVTLSGGTIVKDL